MYEPAMRHLIDTYIRAEESKKISAFDDISLIQLIVERGVGALKDLPAGIASNKEAMAETIENNLRRVITDERPTNPTYYEKMSELLDTLIQERQLQAQEYEQYLARIVELAAQVQNPTSGTAYPKTLNTRAKRALYDNLRNDEQLAIKLDAAIQRTKKDDWRGNRIKEREVRYAILNVLSDETLANQILEIVKHQDEY
jgi:type I restriction enzyme R subunit